MTSEGQTNKDRSEALKARLIPEGSVTRRDFLKVAGGATIALGVAAACGPAATPTAPPEETPAPGATPAATPEATAVPAPEGTGVIIYGSTHEPEAIDPAIGYTLWSRYVDDNAYDALFRYEGDPPQLVNHVAKSYEVSDDGLEWIFHLEEGVKFHDGTELTASDVVYTMQRMVAMQDKPSFLWDTVDPEQLEAIDDYTVKIVLQETFGPFLFTLPWLYIVNEELVRANEVSGDWGAAWMRNNDAGSGPFMITSFDPDVRIDLDYFPEYWKGWPEKRADGWAYEIHRETATLKQLLGAGDIHMSDRLNEDDYPIVDGYPNVTVVESITLTPFQFKLNHQKEPTSNRDFRLALTYALDRAAIVDGLLGGHATYMDSPLPAAYPGYKSLLSTERDLDLARQHLEASGYDPAEITLSYEYVAGDPLQRDKGLVLRDSFAELGIEVTVEGVEVALINEHYLNPETTAHISPIWLSTDYLDAEIIFYPQYHSREPGTGTWYTNTWYRNDEFDELIERARRMPHEEDRIPIYEQLQQMLVDDAVDIWVYIMHWRIAMNECVKGYSFQKVGMWSTFFYPMYIEGAC